MEPVSLTAATRGVGAVAAAAGVVVAGYAVKDAVKERIKGKRSAKDQSTTARAADASRSGIPHRVTHSQQHYPYQGHYPAYQQPFFALQQQAPATGYYPAQSGFPTQTVGTCFANVGCEHLVMQPDWTFVLPCAQDRITLLNEISILR